MKYLVDIETGVRYPVSDEYYEGYMAMIRSIWNPPPLEERYKGVVITGTAGELEAGSMSLQEMFYNPENKFGYVDPSS